MADCTDVYIRHNLDISSFENFKKDIEKRLNIAIDVTCWVEQDDYLEVLPDYTYRGWVLELFENYLEDFDCILTHYNESKIFPSLSFSKYYVSIEGYCVDKLGEWWSVPYWLDKIYEEDIEKYKEERQKIYEISTLFGAQECIMLNGEWLQILCEYLEEGHSLQESINMFELRFPKMEIKKYGNASSIEEYIEVPRKIYVISPHELEPDKKYLGSDDWYDTILVDDFRDFKQ